MAVPFNKKSKSKTRNVFGKNSRKLTKFHFSYSARYRLLMTLLETMNVTASNNYKKGIKK